MNLVLRLSVRLRITSTIETLWLQLENANTEVQQLEVENQRLCESNPRGAAMKVISKL